MKKSYSVYGKKSLTSIAIVAGSMTVAFALGIQTAGDITPVVSTTLADTADHAGDFNGNGHLDVNDARLALEIASGYRSPTPDELARDPNQDFHITNEDVMTILDKLERLGVSTSAEL